jgi:hypothetical protein
MELGPTHGTANPKHTARLLDHRVACSRGIVAAIAVPSYMSLRMAANEASAVGCLRTIPTASTVYTNTYPATGYPASLANLSDGGRSANCVPAPTASAACLIDDNLSSGNKGGYAFTYVPDTSLVPSAAYKVNADPIAHGLTGKRSFFTDVPGVIHWNATGAVTAADLSIPM